MKKHMSVSEYEAYSLGKLAQKSTSGGAITIDMLASQGVVSQHQSLQLEAFYSAIRDKAESVGQLPNKLFRIGKDGSRERVKDGRVHRIWTKKPCEYMTWQEFKEMAVASYETNGFFAAYPVYNERGNLMELIPFRHQNNLTPVMDAHGDVWYTYSTNDGQPHMHIPTSALFLIKNLTLDGYIPIRPVLYQQQLLKIGMNQESSYAELQENGITAQMALATDGKFNDENAIKRLKEDWDKFRGPKGRKTIPILEQGLKPTNLSLTPQEMDFIKSREFTVNRIARMTRVPLHRIGMGVDGKTDMATADELYMRAGLNPILVKLEDQINHHIGEGFVVEIDRKAFYQGSPWKLAEAVTLEFTRMGCTLNEMREDLGRETVPYGDVFAIDTNNLTLGKLEDLEKIQERIYNVNNSNTNRSEEDEK